MSLCGFNIFSAIIGFAITALKIYNEEWIVDDIVTFFLNIFAVLIYSSMLHGVRIGNAKFIYPAVYILPVYILFDLGLLIYTSIVISLNAGSSMIGGVIFYNSFMGLLLGK